MNADLDEKLKLAVMQGGVSRRPDPEPVNDVDPT